jgi:hypothetical protein
MKDVREAAEKYADSIEASAFSGKHVTTRLEAAFEAGARWGIEAAARVADDDREECRQKAKGNPEPTEHALWSSCAVTAYLIRDRIRALAQPEEREG